jgi:hypothetical protein
MRIRQVKPAFWSDAKVAELSERTRLFYIGLWMIADDAGWLRWDASEVARDLYGYESRPRRERRATAMFDELVAAERVVVHPCGHAVVPTMPGHQRLAGSTKQVTSVLNEHLREVSRGSPQVPAGSRLARAGGQERSGTDVVRNGQERSGQSTAHAQDGARLDEPTEFQRRVPRPVPA